MLILERRFLHCNFFERVILSPSWQYWMRATARKIPSVWTLFGALIKRSSNFFKHSLLWLTPLRNPCDIPLVIKHMKRDQYSSASLCACKCIYCAGTSLAFMFVSVQIFLLGLVHILFFSFTCFAGCGSFELWQPCVLLDTAMQVGYGFYIVFGNLSRIEAWASLFGFVLAFPCVL